MKLKKLFAVMLVVALIAASFAACGGTEAPVEEPEDVVEVNVVEEAAMAYFAEYPENNHMITMEALMPLIDAGEEMFIIDTRAADAYAEGHLAGAVNMPFASTAIADNLEVIPDDVPVYVYCYSGQTASQVTSVLNVAGKPVTNIRGGWNRGISTTAGFEAYVSTDEVAMPTDVYEVDADLKAAVEEYFATVASYNGTDYANQNISPEKVKEIVDSGSDEYVILSVRQAVDYAEAHVPGAMNIPFGAGMQEAFADLPQDKTIVVYCYTGHTASQTVGILRLLGYEALNMAFGMGSVETKVGWLGAGYETEAAE